MSYKVETGQTFDTEFKRLAKKYPSLKSEVSQLGEHLSNDPAFGTPIGKSCYKIRVAIKSKGQGKRGGARIITCVVAVTERVVLLSIYDKADKNTILEKEVERILKEEGLD